MDTRLKDIGDGGEFIFRKKDIQLVLGFENMMYLAMFGGNVEASTPVTRLASEQAFDYWGNTLLWSGDSRIQANSETERKLKEVAINSDGRIQIENAVKADLSFMKSFANVEVNVTIESIDRVGINIKITKPDNLQDRDFIYIWDVTSREMAEITFLDTSSTGGDRTFDFTFDISFS